MTPFVLTFWFPPTMIRPFSQDVGYMSDHAYMPLIVRVLSVQFELEQVSRTGL